MARQSVRTIIRELRQFRQRTQRHEPTDQELLEQFLQSHAEDAFETLVRRHGPMVYSLCRRLLAQEADVQDACQATFLVLLQSAHAIRRPSSLASWLYGAALRVAQRIRQRALATCANTDLSEAAAGDDPALAMARRELCQVLDEAVGALADKHRAPLLLCFFEGHTRDQAALHLGCSVRTLDRRLAQAKELLRRQLAQRGLSLPTALLLSELSRQSTQACMPIGLARAVLAQGSAHLAHAGTNFGGGPAALAQEIAANLVSARVRWMLTLIFTFGVLGGVGMVGRALLAPGIDPGQDVNTSATRPDEANLAALVPLGIDCYGDPLPPHALARMGTVRWRHQHIYGALAVALAPDGKTLATGGYTSLRLWDLGSGKLLREFHENYQYSMMLFSPNGKWLFVGREHLLDAATGRSVLRFPERGYPLAFSPDSTLLALATQDHSIVLWNTATGKDVKRLKGHEGNVCLGRFSSDGRQFVSQDQNKHIRHWDLPEGRLLKTVAMPIPQWRTMTMSPGGRTLAVTPYSRASVSLWDTATGQERCRLQGPASSGSYGLAFSPDGRTLTTDFRNDDGLEAQVSLWDTATGQLLRRFPIPYRASGHLEFAPDGRTLVSASGEPRVRLWDSVTGQPLSEHHSHDSAVTSLAFTPNGRTLISGSHDGTVRVWDAATGQHLRVLTTRSDLGYQVAVLPDGRNVLSTGYDGRILMHDLRSGAAVRCLIPDPDRGAARPTVGVPERLAVAPDGRTAASCTRRARAPTMIHLWDLATGAVLSSRDGSSGVTHQIFSPDARLLAERVDLMVPASKEAAKGAKLKARPKAGTKQGGDNLIVTQMVVRDVATGGQVARFSLPDRSVCQPAFAPDGKTLMTATARDVERHDGSRGSVHTFRLWELASGKERWSLTMPETANHWYIETIAFAPDGRTFAAALGDRTIRVVDIRAGKEVVRRGGHEAPVDCFAFAADGRSLASGHRDGTILLWELTAADRNKITK